MKKIKVPSHNGKVRLPIVSMRFWDHIHEEGDVENARPMECEVFGVLWKEDKLSYFVSSWVCSGSIFNSNTETFVILKSTIIDIRRLA